MFTRWGAFVYRFRRPVALLAVVVAVAAGSLATQTSSALSSGGWLDLSSESADVSARLDTQYGAGKSALIAVFRSDQPAADATSAEFQDAIATAVAGLSDDARVSGVVGYAETQDARFISEAGDAAYVIIQLDLADEDSVAAVDDIRAAILPPAGYDYQLTGYGPITKDSAVQSEEDLQKAEVVSLPIAALVLILVFASVVAAGMPLLVAGLAIPSSLALIYLVAQQVEMSIFVLNIATMLGLALAIDYSLFIVSRYREELRRGRTVGEAVERAIGTAGKAITFSGIAVAIGLSGLLLFEAPAIRSIGIAGALVVLCSVTFALTFLPAVLGMLGPRVNALTLGGLVRRFRGASDLSEPTPSSRWERLAHGVMRRPIAVLVPTLAILLIAGSPVLRLDQGVPGAEIYPAGVESRDAYVALQTEFSPGETTPIVILADVTGSPTSPEAIQALSDYAAQIEAIDRIDRVEGPFSITDPRSGAPLTPDRVAALYALPNGQRPAGLDPVQIALVEHRRVLGEQTGLDLQSGLEQLRGDTACSVSHLQNTPAAVQRFGVRSGDVQRVEDFRDALALGHLLDVDVLDPVVEVVGAGERVECFGGKRHHAAFQVWSAKSFAAPTRIPWRICSLRESAPGPRMPPTSSTSSARLRNSSRPLRCRVTAARVGARTMAARSSWTISIGAPSRAIPHRSSASATAGAVGPVKSWADSTT